MCKRSLLVGRIIVLQALLVFGIELEFVLDALTNHDAVIEPTFAFTLTLFLTAQACAYKLVLNFDSLNRFGISLLRIFNHHDVMLHQLVGCGFGKSSAGMEHGIHVRQAIVPLQGLQGVDKMQG